MISDEKALFAPFLSQDDYRPQFMAPFTKDGYVYATEGRILLRIRQDLLKGSYPVYTKLDLSKLTEAENSDSTITLSRLLQAITECPLKEEEILISPSVDCPECDGDGEVEWEYTDSDRHTHYKYFDCPCCNGTGELRPAKYRKTGKMVSDQDSVIGVFGKGFAARNIQIMADTMTLLGVHSVKYVTRHSIYNRFVLADGIDIVIAPMNVKRRDAEIN